MIKVYNDDDLKFVWDLIEKNQRSKKDVADLMDVPLQEVDTLYSSAFKKFNQCQRRAGYIKESPEPQKKKEIIRYAELAEPVKPYERPKANYSNRSPFGIASSGLREQN
jgi:hypothetical protein